MKLVKYIFFVIILIVCIAFIMQLNELNTIDQVPVKIKIPYISAIDPSDDGIKVWEAIIFSITLGVLIGFMIALFQIISQKTEIISLKSKVRRLRNEIDLLRNQSLEEDISLEDKIDTEENL